MNVIFLYLQTQPICPKPSPKDEFPTFGTGPLVTLPGGQRVYRAPPGSLTPAAHRFNDMPSPSRTPVYAPCFSAPSAQFNAPFPTLKNLYLLNQGPSFEQFAMESRMRMAALAPSPIKNTSPTIPVSSAPIGKSHLAAQCAPIKPARSAVGSFAVPLAKQLPSIKPAPSPSSVEKSNPVSNVETSSSTDSSLTVTENKEQKQSENTKEGKTLLCLLLLLLLLLLVLLLLFFIFITKVKKLLSKKSKIVYYCSSNKVRCRTK